MERDSSGDYERRVKVEIENQVCSETGKKLWKIKHIINRSIQKTGSCEAYGIVINIYQHIYGNETNFVFCLRLQKSRQNKAI